MLLFDGENLAHARLQTCGLQMGDSSPSTYFNEQPPRERERTAGGSFLSALRREKGKELQPLPTAGGVMLKALVPPSVRPA